MERDNRTLEADTHLHGSWLTIARLAWIAILLLYLGAFLASRPIVLSRPADLADSTVGWTEADTRLGLAQLGISVNGYQVFTFLINSIVGLLFLVLGIFIFWRRSDDWMAWLVSIFFIITLTGGSFTVLAQSAPMWAVVGAVSDSLGSILFIVLFYIFPDGRFVPRWTRWAAIIVAGIQLWRLFQPEIYQNGAFLLMTPFIASIAVAQIYRYRRVSSPVQRQQTKWIVFGLAAGIAPLVLYIVLIFNLPGLRTPGARGMAFSILGQLLWGAFLVIMLFSFTMAILRSRLWDIDIIIRRTLVYGALTATLALVFFGSVVLMQQIIGGISRTQDSPVAIVISTLLIAALVSPLRRRIQNDIDRRFFRKKYDVQKTLDAFAVTARDEVELEKLTSELLTVVSETMQPDKVSLWLKTRKGSEQ